MSVLDIPLDADTNDLIVVTNISRVVGTNGKHGRKQRGNVRQPINGSFGKEHRGTARFADDDLYDLANGPSPRVPFSCHEWDDHQADALCTRIGAMQQAEANARVNVRRCEWCMCSNEVPAGRSSYCSDKCSRRATLRHQAEQYQARKAALRSMAYSVQHNQTQTKESA